MTAPLVEQLGAFFTRANATLLGEAAWNTVMLTVLGCLAGLTLGFAIAFVRTSGSRWAAPARFIAVVYVEIFRRIPFLVVLFLVLFTMQAFAPMISSFVIAVIAISIVSTAFMAEIIRAGFTSVPRQQVEAAEVMNFSRWKIVQLVILPQAWKVILPPAISFFVMLIKDTALASQMGVLELMFAGKTLSNRGHSSLIVFGTILLIYFTMSWPLARLGKHLEIRLGGTKH